MRQEFHLGAALIIAGLTVIIVIMKMNNDKTDGDSKKQIAVCEIEASKAYPNKNKFEDTPLEYFNSCMTAAGYSLNQHRPCTIENIMDRLPFCWAKENN